MRKGYSSGEDQISAYPHKIIAKKSAKDKLTTLLLFLVITTTVAADGLTRSIGAHAQLFQSTDTQHNYLPERRGHSEHLAILLHHL